MEICIQEWADKKEVNKMMRGKIFWGISPTNIKIWTKFDCFTGLDIQQKAILELIEENRELKHKVILWKTVEEWIKEDEEKVIRID